MYKQSENFKEFKEFQEIQGIQGISRISRERKYKKVPIRVTELNNTVEEYNGRLEQQRNRSVNLKTHQRIHPVKEEK